VITEAVIKGEAEPEYRAERQPHEAQEAAPKIDLKVMNSKSA
jgi:ATP-dependent Clp protease ATP-binding subunit ClpX